MLENEGRPVNHRILHQLPLIEWEDAITSAGDLVSHGDDGRLNRFAKRLSSFRKLSMSSDEAKRSSGGVCSSHWNEILA